MARVKTIAEELAKKQRAISVAEFFERNKHIMGFDTLTRSLVTSVKEGVDNALDACEEAPILPDIMIEMRRLGRDEYHITIEDNGPGIVKRQIPLIYGKLLYGSRFHAIRQARGQQGIGISAVVMYAQLTTGRPTKVLSKTEPDRPAWLYELTINSRKNEPDVLREDVVPWEKDHGTRVELTIKGSYVKEKRQSIYSYLKSTSIVNPHARITFIEPGGTRTVFERATDRLPPIPVEIKPHPEGVELGTLLKMAHSTEAYKMTSFLVNEFSRISYRTAREICAHAMIDENLRPSDMDRSQARRLLEAFHLVRIMAPPTDCLSPIGETLIKKGLRKEMDAEFFATSTRPPAVYSGHPFQVEAGIAYGEELPQEEMRILRFANRVPLLYQQGGCVTTHAISSIDWRRYGLEQRGGSGIPLGPVTALVHVASTSVPFTSESKEAIASIVEIEQETKSALRECGRKLEHHLKKKARMVKLKEKELIIRKILPVMAQKTADVLNRPVPPIELIVAKIMNSVLIEDHLLYVDSERRHEVTIDVRNYTTHGKNFEMIVVIPRDVQLGKIQPPAVSEGNTIRWDVKRIPTGEQRQYSFELTGLDEGDYDETPIYIKGIDPEIVTGAEPWAELDAINGGKREMANVDKDNGTEVAG